MSLPITLILKSKKEVSLSEVFALFNLSSAGYMSGIYFSNSGLSMVNISSRYREVFKEFLHYTFALKKMASTGILY